MSAKTRTAARVAWRRRMIFYSMGVAENHE
jgi:hypothetical protein